MTLCAAIKAVRNATGKSQQSFSNDLSVTVTTVSRWEQGHVIPDRVSRLSLYRIACRLELSDASRALIHASLVQLVDRDLILLALENFKQIGAEIRDIQCRAEEPCSWEMVA